MVKRGGGVEDAVGYRELFAQWADESLEGVQLRGSENYFRRYLSMPEKVCCCLGIGERFLLVARN